MPVESIIRQVGHAGPTRTKELAKVLRRYDFDVPNKLIRLKRDEKVKVNAIVKINFYKNGKRRSVGHWVLRWNGKYYDPSDSVFMMWPNSKATAYLPIESES